MKLSRVSKIVAIVVMVLSSLFFIAPVLWTLVSSVKPENEIQSYPPQWIPKHFTLHNYRLVLDNYPYFRWMFNSIFTSAVGTLGIIICSTLAAYALARFEFRGSKTIFRIIVVMLLVPIQAYVIPLYLMSARMGMLNSLTGIILPSIANVTSIFILYSFFKDLPKEYEEAARIDGCNEFKIFYRVMLPLSGPAISTVTILTFIVNWNSFLWPMISVRQDAYRTLPVAIAQYWGAVNQNASFQYGTALAASCMAVIPTLIVYFILQKYFVSGIASSGIKG